MKPKSKLNRNDAFSETGRTYMVFIIASRQKQRCRHTELTSNVCSVLTSLCAGKGKAPEPRARLFVPKSVG